MQLEIHRVRCRLFGIYILLSASKTSPKPHNAKQESNCSTTAILTNQKNHRDFTFWTRIRMSDEVNTNLVEEPTEIRHTVKSSGIWSAKTKGSCEDRAKPRRRRGPHSWVSSQPSIATGDLLTTDSLAAVALMRHRISQSNKFIEPLSSHPQFM